MTVLVDPSELIERDVTVTMATEGTAMGWAQPRIGFLGAICSPMMETLALVVDSTDDIVDADDNGAVVVEATEIRVGQRKRFGD